MEKDRILLKAVFWDYPEYNDEKKLREAIAAKPDIKKWILSRFLEHGRVIDTLKFFDIGEIDRMINSIRISENARKKWLRLIEVYGT
jgi:hypothetical protein